MPPHRIIAEHGSEYSGGHNLPSASPPCGCPSGTGVTKSAFGHMDQKQFDMPVTIMTPNGAANVASTVEARGFLSSVDWPERGNRHEEALDACLKVLDGHRSTVDARNAFIEAAREARILVE